jgi:hypothetical protein
LGFAFIFSSVQTSWIRINIRNADPDPGGHRMRIQCGSGSKTLVKLLENPNPAIDMGGENKTI